MKKNSPTSRNWMFYLLFVSLFIFIVDGTVDSLTLQMPVNNNYSTNVLQDFSYIVSGNRATYDCELLVNNTGYGRNQTTSNRNF